MYDAEFLLALRNDPKSNRKPEIVHSDVYVGTIAIYVNFYVIVSFVFLQRAICVKSNAGGRTDFAPSFGNSFMGKSSSAHQVCIFF